MVGFVHSGIIGSVEEFNKIKVEVGGTFGAFKVPLSKFFFLTEDEPEPPIQQTNSKVWPRALIFILLFLLVLFGIIAIRRHLAVQRQSIMEQSDKTDYSIIDSSEDTKHLKKVE